MSDTTLTTIQVPKTLRDDLKDLAALEAKREHMNKLSMVDYLQRLAAKEKKSHRTN